MKFQIIEIEFDCSLDSSDDDWTFSDQLNTEDHLSTVYPGTIWDADDEDDLIEEISCESGWCIKSLDYRIILK